MPNTAVKPRSGYNTWDIKPWENSTVPNYKKDFRKGSLFSLQEAREYKRSLYNNNIFTMILCVLPLYTSNMCID